MHDFELMISQRSKAIDVSGIRRVFELGAKLKDPINLSIGQPDFPVPETLKEAAIEAIRQDKNGYTLTQGVAELRDAINRHLTSDIGWDMNSSDTMMLVTSGTSGALLLAVQALLNPGDEIIAGDPYFVVYPSLAELCGATFVPCDTYPDCRMTAARVEPLITDRTKIVLVNSPGNPSGVVLTNDELKDLVDLCKRKGVLLISDEIYDEFTYEDAREDGRCPSPARFDDQMLVVRGFGKSYGCTGWRMGYVAGPASIIREMAKLQQYTFVCAPSMSQYGLVGVFDVDMTSYVEAYRRKRDMVIRAFDGVANLATPGGAFYAFVEVPESMGLTATQFVEKGIEQNVLTIPGNVFSKADTHFRISYATSDDKLEAGLEVLTGLMAQVASAT
ncbi:MAG: aminotransferase class I/II-fold pyridoxal phosphate-dependent enzyme [Planctomycetota bacterium]|nr:aminotransferase class I/II-fold pyridoxal phosphate-dependent enzyme [Planctomycetota bacterium]